MNFTLKPNPEMVRRLNEETERNGLTVEQFIERLVEQKAITRLVLNVVGEANTPGRPAGGAVTRDPFAVWRPLCWR
jgi:hypothetical protein